MAKHIVLRILLLLILLFLAVTIAYSTLDPNRRCGTGDILSILFWMSLSYILWSAYLLGEAIYLHRKKQNRKRNFNLITVLVLPILFFLICAFSR